MVTAIADRIRDNHVWDLLPNGKTLGRKWLFKKKTDMDGVVHTYKTCLLAKGFTQTHGVDYEETFSPVIDIRAIKFLIAIDAFYDYKDWKMNVKTAFLNKHLSEEVYMVQPEDEIKKFGFTLNRDEPCVYMKAIRSNVTFLILYVDDILIMGTHIPMLQDVKSYLGRCFAMKDLGEAAHILGIKIYRDRSRRLIGLCPSDYIEKILKRFFMENSKRRSIPNCVNYKNITSRFQHNPGDLNWTAVKNILKYLRNTNDMFFVYGGDIKRELRVSCYTVVGYLTDVNDLKSQTGYVFVLNGANESGITKGARHYRVKVYYLHEDIEFGDIKLEKAHTDDNLADPFTKALPFPKHSEHTKNIGMLSASSLM
ncbi:retrotransposon protein, putative, ty1-copia subclass [Tanacetum coccineum]